MASSVATATGVGLRARWDRWWTRNQIKVVPYIFISPFFIVFALFMAYPVVDAFVTSFMRQQGIDTPEFVGLRNYINLTQDPRYLKSLVNTTEFALGSIFILSPLAFLLAIAVNSRLVPWPNVKSSYRLAFFVPLLTSAVVTSLMFGILYDYNSGFLNALLTNLFGSDAKVGWIRDPKVALWSILIISIWQFTGLNSLYFLAGLQNIPKEVEEAAVIDGAGKLALLWSITLPMLRPVILFVVVQAINGAYQLFAQPLLLTGGGPSDATVTMTLYLYETGFQYFNLGYAAAIGWSLVLIIVALAVIQLKLFGAFRDD
jgi:ABC-type sugar transport system permease subunit